PLTDSHHFIRHSHSPLFNFKNFRVDMFAGAVDLGCMNVDNQGLSTGFFCGGRSLISHPVVCVDKVESMSPGNLARYMRIAVNLGEEISAVAPGESKGFFH